MEASNEMAIFEKNLSRLNLPAEKNTEAFKLLGNVYYVTPVISDTIQNIFKY